jgi:DNA-binding transcriptional regulator YhcF (GntR family)
MILRVDSTRALPVYEQIREQVVRMVLAGTIEPGTRLPTIRQLANDLQLAKGTVAKAYALLEESKILETRGHRGSFILAPPEEQPIEELDLGAELASSAEAYVIAAKQLGVDLDSAQLELRKMWDRL